ncbi:MAG: 3'-5' exonuclease [Acidobacteriota bacterium]
MSRREEGPAAPLDRLEAVLLGAPEGRMDLAEAAALCLKAASGTLADRVMAALAAGDARFAVGDGTVRLRVRPPEPPLDLEEAEFAVVDFETNGLGGCERAIEVGVALFRGGREVGAFESLLQPDTGLSSFVVGLTGIREEDLRGAPRFESVWAPLKSLLRGRVLTAHNLAFDRRVLRMEAVRMGAALPKTAGEVCTLRLARAVLGRAESRGLDALALRFGLSFSARHRALDDARVAGRLLFRLIEAARERLEVRTLDDLARLQGTRPKVRRAKT